MGRPRSASPSPIPTRWSRPRRTPSTSLCPKSRSCRSTSGALSQTGATMPTGAPRQSWPRWAPLAMTLSTNRRSRHQTRQPVRPPKLQLRPLATRGRMSPTPMTRLSGCSRGQTPSPVMPPERTTRSPGSFRHPPMPNRRPNQARKRRSSASSPKLRRRLERTTRRIRTLRRPPGTKESTSPPSPVLAPVKASSRSSVR